MSGSYRSEIIKEVDPKILDEFYDAALEFMNPPAKEYGPYFLNLLRKAIAVANSVSMVNETAAIKAKIVDARIEGTAFAAVEFRRGIPERYLLSPRMDCMMLMERSLFASLVSEKSASEVIGLLNSVLLVAHENGEPEELVKTKAGVRMRPIDSLTDAMVQQWCNHFGYSRPLAFPVSRNYRQHGC